MLPTVLALLLALAQPVQASEPVRLLALATGDVTGAYFASGVALCRVVNAGRREHGLRCSAETSGGSVANLAALQEGRAQLALVQSDVLADALAGTGAYQGAPLTELRAVGGVFVEVLTLVARADAGLAGPADLAQARVSLGPETAGQRALVEALLDAADVAPVEALALEPRAAVAALCDRRIDAFFFAVGHPALAVREATSACGAVLVPIDGNVVDTVVAAGPKVSLQAIPGGLYAGAPDPVPGPGVVAVLVARADLDDSAVDLVTRSILGALPDLAGFDPVLAGLDPQAMAERAAAVAPLHPGALAAYAAAGVAP